jgi:hypothetical protein
MLIMDLCQDSRNAAVGDARQMAVISSREESPSNFWKRGLSLNIEEGEDQKGA